VFPINILVARYSVAIAAGVHRLFARRARVTGYDALSMLHSTTQDQFSAMVRGVQDYAMFLLTPDGIVSTWNAGAERIKGYRADEIIGRHFSIFYQQADRERGWPAHELQVASTAGRFEDEGWRVRKDGTPFWANVVITPWRDETGTLAGFLKITRDLTNRREVEVALRETEEQFRQLVMNAGDYAMIRLDRQGVVASWNPGAERIKGYTADEIIGRHFSVFYPPDAVAAGWPERELDIARRDGTFEDEGWRIRKDGTMFWANAVITAFTDDAGALKGFWKITRDLTERKRAEDQLKEATERLRRSNRELEQFASVAAHDLQEPLRKIQAFGGRLRTRSAAALDEAGADYLARILDAAGRMRRLIDDLLAFSRISTRPEPFVSLDLRTAIEDVLVDLEVRLQHTGGRVDIGELPPVLAAPSQMRQLFLNLIGNALKFRRPHVAPLVAIAGRRRRDMAEITVRDNGIGFEPEYRERIFEVFQRLHGRQEYEGTGIGLAICRKIVERHGGSISADGRPGAGASFTFTLPLDSGGGPLGEADHDSDGGR
jgi:PAS domain S-box-containing protein